MNNTIKYLRQIADHMSKAADHLADAAHLQSMLDDGPPAEVWQGRVDAEVTAKLAERIAELDAELARAIYREPTTPEVDASVWSVGPSGVDEYDDAAIGDAGPMVVDAAVWREPVEPTGERHPNIGAALDRCRDVLGWDPDTLSSVRACSAIAELMSLDELDCAETLEKRRVEMSPRRSSRSTVLTAIAKRRSELEAAGVQS
jgi:hypothetical protein